MKNIRLKILGWFLLCPPLIFLLLVIPLNGRAAEPPKTLLKSHLRQAVARGFDLDEKSAMAEISKAIELNREEPLGYAVLAMTYLFFYETSFTEKEKKARENGLRQAVEDAVDRGEKRLEKAPRDGDACFALALAKMVLSRWEFGRKNYFRGFRESQSIWDYLEKTREADPGNYDVYFPMGVLHYHLDHLSAAARFFTSIFLTSADKAKGLQELQTVSQKGDLLQDMARAELVAVYSSFEKEPGRVLSMARELKAKYPRNYNFHFAVGNILSDMNQPAEAFAIAQEIEKGLSSRQPPWRPELWGRYHQFLGKLYLDSGEYEKAAQSLQRALRDEAPYNSRVRAWANVRLGMIADLRKDRKTAEACYRKGLEVEGAEGLAQITARQYLKTPFALDSKAEKVR